MPGRAAWPCVSLMPRYLGLESRPFFVDPPAFVCAINAIVYVAMTIADIQEWGKALLAKIPPQAVILAILVLSSTASFGLGIMAGKDLERARTGASGAGQGFWIEHLGQASSNPAAAIEAVSEPVSDISAAASGAYVASKNGSKYYLVSCSGAGRIKEANKVYFSSRAEAEGAGYQPAANCPGL